MTTDPARRPWSLEDVREILAGAADPSQLRERVRTADRKGLSPVTFAAMKAAATADSLTPLLGLLEPPGEEERSKLDLILDLLERVAENQVELGRRLAFIESRLAGTSVASPTGLPAVAARRASAP